MISEAIILAGGFGTRLQSVVSDVPKPMASVCEQPFLNYLISYLEYYGIRSIILSTGHKEEVIREYYTNNPRKLSVIAYSHETKPLGTGGAIALAMHLCKSEDVIVVNGDSFFDVDLKDFYRKHQQEEASHSLALRRVEDSSRYGAIEKKENRLVAFREKSNLQSPGLINGGVYILNKADFLSATEGMEIFSIEKDFFEKYLESATICGFEYSGSFIDIGTPEDYARAQNEFKQFKY